MLKILPNGQDFFIIRCCILHLCYGTKQIHFVNLGIRNVGVYHYDVIAGYRYNIFGFWLGFAVLDKPQKVLQTRPYGSGGLFKL